LYRLKASLLLSAVSFSPRRFVLCLVVLAAQVALAEPPPPDIQALLQKLRSGQRLTTDEQTRMRSWQQQKLLEAGGGRGQATGDAQSGGMPADVAAAMEKARRGVPPSPAEIELLRGYGERLQSQKDALLENERATRTLLEQARPPPPDGGAPQVKSPFLDADVSIDETTQVTHRLRCDTSETTVTDTTTTSTTAHVRVRTREPGKPLSVTASVSDKGPFSVLLEPLGLGTTSVSGTGQTCEGPKQASSSNPGVVMGELNVDPKRRVMVNLPPGFSLDAARTDVVWQGSSAVSPEMLAAYPQVGAAMSQLPASMKAARAGATFDLPGEALRDLLHGKGTEVGGTYVAGWRDDDGGSVSKRVRYTIRLSQPEAPKLSLAFLDASGAANADAWKKWVPTPWLESADEAKLFGLQPKDPSTVVRIGLKVDGNVPCDVKVELTDVLELAGLTTNYPVFAQNPRKSIKLLTEGNEGWTVAADGQSATSKRPLTTAELRLVAVDPAGYGRVQVTCTSRELQTVFAPSGNLPYVELPKDENHNHVADGWEYQVGAYGQRLSETWDEDENPKGQRRSGDGFTFFEEYRGFIVRESSRDKTRKHVRTQWNTKDGFVYDRDWLFDKYVMPTNPTGITWHFVDPELLSVLGDVDDPKHRQVNTSTPTAFRYAPQYALDVQWQPSFEEGAQAQGRPGAPPSEATFLHPMKNFYRIVVNPQADQRLYNERNFPQCSVAQLGAMVERSNAATLPHEVGHALGAMHHLRHPPDIRHPPLDTNGRVRWPDESVGEQTYYGVIDCVMRYNATPEFDKPTNDRCQVRTLERYCRAGDTAVYFEGGRQVTGPSNDCWHQLDVKSDP
jgi:hypothetical protein